MDLSIVILTSNEAENVRTVIPEIIDVADDLGVTYEMVVVDNDSRDGTADIAERLGARVVQQTKKGFGNALKEGFGESRGDHILTLDADLSHPPSLIADLWHERDYDIVIASRWVPKGGSDQLPPRKYLSLFMNLVFRALCSIPIRDLNSNFRLYRKEAILSLALSGTHFEILPEILIKAYGYGYSIKEIPFYYRQREKGKSKLRILPFGMAYAKNLLRLWRMRNSVESVDYDERAYKSKIPLQRYWQRKRERIVRSMISGNGRILDVGCGSSMILQNLNKERDIVGLDISEGKLKYLSQKKEDYALVMADIRHLPFVDDGFDCLIASNVIEHVRNTDAIFEEMRRVLRKGGVLILALPDYSSPYWKIIEPVYDFIKFGGSYKEEHVMKLTRKDVSDLMEESGFDLSESHYILGSELICKATLSK